MAKSLLNQVDVYRGDAIPLEAPGKRTHHPDKFYFAPRGWDARSPFSAGFETPEDALKAAGEWAERMKPERILVAP